MGGGASYFGAPPSAFEIQQAKLDQIKKGAAGATAMGQPQGTYRAPQPAQGQGILDLLNKWSLNLDSLVAMIKKPTKVDNKQLTNLWAQYSMEHRGPQGSFATLAGFKNWLEEPMVFKEGFGRSRVQAQDADHWTSFLKKNGLYTDVTGVNR
jgi:hypothetical protein